MGATALTHPPAIAGGTDRFQVSSEKRSRVVRTTIAVLTIALVFALCVMGQAPRQPAPITDDKVEQPALPSLLKGTHEMTASDVEAFLDGIVPLQLSRND